MKPLANTPGTKEGSFNENQVLKSIPSFPPKHPVTRSNGVQFVQASVCEGDRFCRANYICSVGLIGSATIELVAGSPDGISSISDDVGEVHVVSIEIKTVTSLPTIEKARNTRDSYGVFTSISNIGRSRPSQELFHAMVPTSPYRLQCLHHAAVLGNPGVPFVVPKGSTTGIGEIIYGVLLWFAEPLLASYNYNFCKSSIRLSCFKWIARGANEIPKEYDYMLQETQAADLFSLASFYNLSQAYKTLAKQQGPLPPARMIRPTSLVFWNQIKGGLDQFSTTLKSLCYQNTSESPIVSVLSRLLCAHINNAAVVHRFSLEKARGLLPDASTTRGMNRKGYESLRHGVATCCTFSSFARFLAKELNHSQSMNVYRKTMRAKPWQHFSADLGQPSTSMYVKEAVAKYNRPADAERRLSSYALHKRVKAKDVSARLTLGLRYAEKCIEKRRRKNASMVCILPSAVV